MHFPPDTAAPAAPKCPACHTVQGLAPDVMVATLGLVAVFGLAAMRSKLCEAHGQALDLIVQRASAREGAQPLSRQQRRAQRRKGIVIL